MEISVLALVYDDLATRNCTGRLNYETFLSFFSLNGLWGEKLFRQFDEDSRELISF